MPDKSATPPARGASDRSREALRIARYKEFGRERHFAVCCDETAHVLNGVLRALEAVLFRVHVVADDPADPNIPTIELLHALFLDVEEYVRDLCDEYLVLTGTKHPLSAPED